MTLLENEVKLDSLTPSVQLTNFRIVKEHKNSYKISVFLEKISSIIGIAFTIGFFLTKKQVITISQNGGEKLDIEAKGVAKERIEEFITNIQEAKQKKHSGRDENI